MPTTTGVTIIGRISVPRIARTNRTSFAHRSASPKPSAVSTMTAAATNSSVVRSELRNVGSCSAWT